MPALERGRGVPGALRWPVGTPPASGVPALAAAFRFKDMVAFCAMPRPSWSLVGTLAILKAGPAGQTLVTNQPAVKITVLSPSPLPRAALPGGLFLYVVALRLLDQSKIQYSAGSSNFCLCRLVRTLMPLSSQYSVEHAGQFATCRGKLPVHALTQSRPGQVRIGAAG